MKKILILILVICLSACTSVNSVVDNSNLKHYSKYLVVMTYDDGIVKRFVTHLHKAFLEQFAKDGKNVATILHHADFGKLQLNEYDGLEKEINNKIVSEQIDLIIIFKPQTFYNTYGKITDADYVVVAVDPQTNKEVWKSKFLFKSILGNPYKSSTEKLYRKLKSDKIIL